MKLTRLSLPPQTYISGKGSWELFSDTLSCLEKSEITRVAWKRFWVTELLGKDTLQPLKLLVGCVGHYRFPGLGSCHPCWSRLLWFHCLQFIAVPVNNSAITHWFTKLDFAYTLTLVFCWFPIWGEKTFVCLSQGIVSYNRVYHMASEGFAWQHTKEMCSKVRENKSRTVSLLRWHWKVFSILIHQYGSFPYTSQDYHMPGAPPPSPSFSKQCP